MGRYSGRPTESTTIERVRTFAQGRAIAARALGRDDRDWLDLLAIIEQSEEETR